MSSTSSTRGPARETRLLLLTLCVSVAVLFVLARFRFPERPISELAAPQPLTRLARTTTFDDLSATLGDILRRAGDAQVAVPVSDADGVSRLVPGLRIRDDLAIAVVSGSARVEGDPTPVVARDEVRGLVLVRVPAQPAPTLPIQPPNESLELPGFLVFIDAAPGGPSIRADFVSRATPQPHAAWDAPLLALGGIATARPGSLVFTLGGRFIGMVLADDDQTLVAPGDALIARADRLTRGESILAANPGLAVQPLSPGLAKATRADHGVIVAAINGASVTVPVQDKALTVVRVGDVIQAIDGDEIRSVGDWERVLGHRAPGTTVTLRIARPEGPAQARLVLRWRYPTMIANANQPPSRDNAGGGSAAKPAGALAFGLSLRGASKGDTSAALEVIAVTPNSPAGRAGLHAGDRLVAMPAAFPASAAHAEVEETSAISPPPTPLTPVRVDAAFNALASGDALLLSISRAGQPLLVAVERAAVERAAVDKP